MLKKHFNMLGAGIQGELWPHTHVKDLVAGIVGVAARVSGNATTDNDDLHHAINWG